MTAPDTTGAGMAIMTGMADGVGMGGSQLDEAIATQLARARELLAGSDARRGPLSDLTASGKSIMETLAAGVLLSNALNTAIEKKVSFSKILAPEIQDEEISPSQKEILLQYLTQTPDEDIPSGHREIILQYLAPDSDLPDEDILPEHREIVLQYLTRIPEIRDEEVQPSPREILLQFLTRIPDIPDEDIPPEHREIVLQYLSPDSLSDKDIQPEHREIVLQYLSEAPDLPVLDQFLNLRLAESLEGLEPLALSTDFQLPTAPPLAAGPSGNVPGNTIINNTLELSEGAIRISGENSDPEGIAREVQGAIRNEWRALVEQADSRIRA